MPEPLPPTNAPPIPPVTEVAVPLATLTTEQLYGLRRLHWTWLLVSVAIALAGKVLPDHGWAWTVVGLACFVFGGGNALVRVWGLNGVQHELDSRAAAGGHGPAPSA